MRFYLFIFVIIAQLKLYKEFSWSRFSAFDHPPQSQIQN